MPEKSISDKEFIQNPDHWPRWPFLPLKRGSPLTGEGDVGILYDAEGYLTTVFLVNLYLFNTDHLDKMPQKHYPSIDDLLADGWAVD